METTTNNLLNKFNLKYFINDDIIKINNESFLKFQKDAIKNAKIKWVVEWINGEYPYCCESDESDIEFDIQRYYFDSEEDAMIEYFNLTQYKNEYNVKSVILAPKKILYFDI